MNMIGLQDLPFGYQEHWDIWSCTKVTDCSTQNPHLPLAAAVSLSLNKINFEHFF